MLLFLSRNNMQHTIVRNATENEHMYQ